MQEADHEIPWHTWPNKKNCCDASCMCHLKAQYVGMFQGSLQCLGAHAGGSGSGYITGFCDKFWRPGMSAEQCEDFVRRAVGHALARDGSSGGCIRTVTLTKEGVKRSFTPNDRVSSHGGCA